MSDHLGSSSIRTDATGTVTETRDFKPYGTLAYENISQSSDNQYKFTGKERDAESGLDYFGARHLSNAYARFTAADPILLTLHDEQTFKDLVNRDPNVILTDPQQLNSYAYAGNNPLKNIDQDGNILDVLVDIGFIAYDLYQIGKDFTQHGQVRQENVNALGLDVGGAFVPFATGFGMAARVVSKGDDVVDAARTLKSLDHSNDIKLLGTQRQNLLNDIKSKQLRNIVEELYRPNAKVGPAKSTADAIRHELITGELVGGKSHIQKGQYRLSELNKFLQRTDINEHDRAAARFLRDDLYDAFNLKP